MFKKSFTNEVDDTFEPGMISLDTNDFLKVLAIEVWGLPERDSFRILREFREREQNRRKNDAMRNKKALFDNDFNRVELTRK